MKHDCITIIEHEAIVRGEETDLSEYPKVLKKEDFDLLKTFILTPPGKKEDNTESYLRYFVKDKKEQIGARHYTGVILLKSGTSIEILPKIANETNEDVCRKIFISMLSELHDIPFIRARNANLNKDKLPVFEYFIRMFIEEVERLQKCGFHSKYVEQQSNENCFKGKLLITEHIRYNFAHAERFYVQYDEYNLNRPINRLIKATLEYLLRETNNWRNKQDIRKLLNLLEPIQASVNYELDIARADFDRNMSEFLQIFEWCKIFLQKKSFTPFSGETSATALLFNMNVLFECYVAAKLKRYIPNLLTQYEGTYLFNEQENGKENLYPLRPDLVIGIDEKCPLILDTKWKLPDKKPSQSDMYQMYVYLKKYGAKKAILLYPDPLEETEERCWRWRSEGAPEEEYAIEMRFINLSWEKKEWELFAGELKKEWEECRSVN